MGVLRIQSFRRLLASYAANQLAWSIANLALSLLIFRRTGSAWASTGFFLVSEFLPAFVASRLVVALERFATRKILAGTYAAQAVVFFILSVAPSHFVLPPVLAVVFLAGIVELLAIPFLRAATVHVTAPVGLLRNGNAALNGAAAASILAGPLLASAVIASLNITAALLVVGALFVLMSLTLARAEGLPVTPPERPESQGVLRAAARYVAADRAVRRILAFQAIALVFFSVSTPIEVVLAERSLGAGAAGYGALLSAWGAGAVIGSVGYARWSRVPGWLMMAFGTACVGVAFVVMGTASDIWPAIGGAIIGGIGNGTEAVAERTALQESADEKWMTLIQSFNESMMLAVPGVGFLLGGALAELGGARLAFVVGGIGGLVVAVAARLMLRRLPTVAASHELQIPAKPQLSPEDGTLEM